MTALSSHASVMELLDQWVNAGWLRSLDRAFARFVCDEAVTQAQPVEPLLVWLAACLSHQCGRGHTCLTLATLQTEPDHTLALPPERKAQSVVALPALPSSVLQGITADQLHSVLAASPWLVGGGEGNTPLVWVNERLYLRRYWQYEQDIHAALTVRLAQPMNVEETNLQRLLSTLFTSTNLSPDWQKIACALAARSAFAVITGGPGTGKTTTVVKLLAVLQGMALAQHGTPLVVSMAAPTGKAAARLNESISLQIDQLRQTLEAIDPRIADVIKSDVRTLHKLLGTIPGSRHFRHNTTQPLPADVIVIDEASMVDVEMMANVLAALKPHARLILLGDKDQLASVEPGAVLGQLCEHAEAGRYTPDTVAWVKRVAQEAIPPACVSSAGTALDQAITMLRHSHRFGSDSGIGTLSRAVNAGDIAAVLQCLAANRQDIHHIRMANTHDTALDRLLQEGYGPYLQRVQAGPESGDRNAWALEILRLQSAFQVLCAVRQGDWGVQGLNQRAESVLRSKHLLPAAGEWYAGRPVLVTRNDYGLGLMNGDMGITLLDAENKLRVVFADVDAPGGVRWVLPARLPDVETVFAMTVHKSQGSEFGHAVVVLPDQVNPACARELLYTGITRAAKQFTLVDSSDAVLQACVERRVLRSGGVVV